MNRIDSQNKSPLLVPRLLIVYDASAFPIIFQRHTKKSLGYLYFKLQKLSFYMRDQYLPGLIQLLWITALAYSIFLPWSSLRSEETLSTIEKYKNRIKLFQIVQYAPKEVQESLKEWESTTSESEGSTLSKRFEFYQKACLSALIPLFSEERKKAKEALDSAEESFAESLAGEHYSRAMDLFSEGEVLTAGLSHRLEEIEKEDISTQKEVLIENLFQDAELGLSKWRESMDIASKSMSLSLSQASALHYSQSDLLETLQLIRKYRPSTEKDSVHLTILERDIEEGLSWILKGKIKQGFTILEETRKKFNEQVALEFRGFAKNKLEDSHAKLEAAEKLIQLQHSKFEDDLETLAQLEDNLRAARESYILADHLYKEEKFIESITSAEDSLFLTERFQEDIESASIPEKRIYQEDPDPKPSKKNFSGLLPPKIHKVRKGDSLVGISEFYFKNYRKWREIYQKNRKSIQKPNKIFPYQILVLPTP